MDIKTIVISENTNTIELLKLYLDEYAKFNNFEGVEDFTKAYPIIKDTPLSFVIVDISQYQEQAINFISKITQEFPKFRVAVISDKLDTDLIIRIMRVGVLDFISKPFIKTDLFNIFDKVYDDITGAMPKKSKCRIISVYSNKGGVGKTSVAANLAFELAKITKENIALVDLNFQFGDITTFLDLKPSFNISYMLQNLNKLNEEFLLSSMEKYKDTSLYVLADPPFFKPADGITLESIAKLFNILRNTFSYVVVDTASGFDNKALKALELSDLVLFPTIVNLPALRNCQRCLEYFDKMNFDSDKIHILINRFMENDEITSEDVEDVLGKDIYWKIPNNYFSMMSAINKGVPVSEINSGSNVALGYKNLALLISDSIYKKRKYNVEQI